MVDEQKVALLDYNVKSVLLPFMVVFIEVNRSQILWINSKSLKLFELNTFTRVRNFTFYKCPNCRKFPLK